MKMMKNSAAQLALLLLLMAFSSAAFAGEPMPWDGTLKKIGDALVSSTAFYVAVIAFAASALSMVWGNEMSDTMKKIAGTTIVVSFLVGVPGFLKNILGIQVTGAEIPMHAATASAPTIVLIAGVLAAVVSLVLVANRFRRSAGLRKGA